MNDDHTTVQPSTDLNTSTIALLGFVGAILIFAIIVALMVLYYHDMQKYDQRKLAAPAEEWSTVKAEQETRLNTALPPAPDQPEGRLSIEEAMKKTLESDDAAAPLVPPPSAEAPSADDSDGSAASAPAAGVENPSGE
ncbi:MAG: hypothetical protein D6741_05855 [Planctomycetota bacterium]|nr:MAG: hypothetical protein D6741_05855 [Planctomycetota bacterium]